MKPGPFNKLMDRIRAGDRSATVKVHERFVHRLTALARSKLDEEIRAKLDPEDVVQSVFRSFFLRHREHQFGDIDGWENLWSVLALITVRKCHNKREYFHAARRDVRRELALADNPAASEQVFSSDPTPEQAAALSETVTALMQGLSERARSILVLYLQGYSIPEISGRIGRARRTVWRTITLVRTRLARMQEEAPM